MGGPNGDHRAVRDRLNAQGADGDLYMRLRGFYWRGPAGTAEPEFGYSDFSRSRLHTPIQDEAAALIEWQSGEIAKLRALL